MNQAFVLGAGLGTRLQPLTHRLPKPLVPLFHRPLAARAMDACMRAGISRFALNTHHLAHCWKTFGEPVAASEPVSAVNGIMPFWREYRGCELAIFHEPELLETGGGLKNIARWMGNAPLLIHNGDIFSSMPLDRLIAAHRAQGRPVTLALRSHGPATHIALDSSGTRVIDIRGRLGQAESTHGFSGIYCVDPEFLALLPEGQKTSVIPAFLELAEAGKLGAVVIDEGDWLDLGDRESYLRAHQELALGPRIHPDAKIAADARITGSVIGPAAKIGAGARLRNCVVWPGGEVAAGADLERCVVFSETPASGQHLNVDL